MVQAAVCAYHDSTLRSTHVLAALGRRRYVGDDAAVERICAAGARALSSCQYMATERMSCHEGSRTWRHLRMNKAGYEDWVAKPIFAAM